MTPTLIAHRGEPVSFPENSIAGYEAVLQAGANWIETDVQITADGVPVLCHDPSLLKLTGHDMNINTTVYADMQDLPAGYPARFAAQRTPDAARRDRRNPGESGSPRGPPKF